MNMRKQSLTVREKVKNSHIALSLVVLFIVILGATFYWIKSTNSLSSYAGLPQSAFTVKIDSDTRWSGTIGGSATRTGEGAATFTINSAMASACIQKQTDYGYLTVTIIKNGEIIASQTTNDSFGVVAVSSLN